MATTGRLNRASIVIRRRRHEEEGDQENGSWKIAYADFTTMMMAFFMLLWLVNITSPEQKEGIADYFNPISVSSSHSGADGQLAGQSVATASGALTSSASSAWETIPTARVPALSPPGPDPVVVDGDPGDNDGHKPASGAGKGDLTLGEVAAGDIPPGPVLDPGLAEQMARVAAEQASFERIEAELKAALAIGGDLADLSENLIFDITPDGLRIQITDRPHFSMFEVASVDVNGRAASLLQVVAQALATVPNPVAVAGHTDGRAFAATARYGNWELSSDRANAARRILAANGIAATRLARVEGLADTLHLFPDAPEDPRNRRISITLLRQVPLPMERP